MNWDDLRFFLAAHRQGSFVAAAQALQVEPSTVSRRIARLETSLGGALFLRSSEGLLPTERAQIMFPRAERLEEEATQMALQATEDPGVRGTVKLATTEGLAQAVIIPNLSKLTHLYPHLRLELLTGLHVVDLSRREADLAVRFGRVGHADLVSRHLVTSTCGVYVHRQYLEGLQALGRPATAEDLPWIGLAQHLAHYAEAQWMDQHLSVEPVLRVSSYPSMFYATREGLGAALLSDAYAATAPELVSVELALPPGPILDLYLVSHRMVRSLTRVDVVWRWLLSLASGFPAMADKLKDHNR